MGLSAKTSACHILLPFLVLGILLVSFGNSFQNTLKCYQCVIQGKNESICDNELQRCPNDQAYDRCMINVMKNQTTGDFIIIKRCALAPCEFEKSVERTLGFVDKCILSKRDPDCVKCCSGDGCNKRATENLAYQLASSNSVKSQLSTTARALQFGILIGFHKMATLDLGFWN